MATIEPRLIHLLNESTTPQLSHNDLPPLHALPFTHSPDRSLPPLDPDAAAARGEREGRYAGSSSAYPLRVLLGETEGVEGLQSYGKTFEDGSEWTDDASNKKRTRNLNVKDDFVQLPQPVKKQKAAQQSLAFPPIINGLHEPPPHAALFPPIASHSFEDNDANQAANAYDYSYNAEDRASQPSSSEADRSSTKTRKRATKPRRKWSEAETNHLLLGVDRHGVGKWTSILEDPDFTFNHRTAGDLKDRFRTCCPEELRRSSKSSQANSPPSTSAKDIKHRAKKGIHSENILIEDDDLSPKEGGDSSRKQKKSRAHRKKMEDLAELGIRGPFKKSHRRERRPFTEQDDREILEGLDIYGPAWTKIQRDSRFHLTSRQPTDLRDRVRNKYPAVYHRIEKGTFQPRDDSRSNGVLEPSVNMSVNHSLKRSKAAGPQMSRRNSREELPRWPLHLMETSDYPQVSQAFELSENSAPHFMGGEMDISRLLLDDSRTPVSGRYAGDRRPGSSSPPEMSTEPRRHHSTMYSVRC